MIQEKRQCERTDVFLIVEFRPVKKNLRYSLGITRDFSHKGFSFESQNCDLKRGEVLDIVLKHPQRDVSLSAMGEIVWEKGAWYARLVGVKLSIMDQEARRTLSDLMGASRDMTWESFNGKRDSGTHVIQKEAKKPAAEVKTSGIVTARLEELKNTNRKISKQGLLSGTKESIPPSVALRAAAGEVVDKAGVKERIKAAETGDDNQRDINAGKPLFKGLKIGKRPELPDWSPLTVNRRRVNLRRRKGNLYLLRIALFALVTVAALIIPFEEIDKGEVPLINNAPFDTKISEMPSESLHAEYIPEISGKLPEEEGTIPFDGPETPLIIDHAEGELPVEISDNGHAGDVGIKRETTEDLSAPDAFEKGLETDEELVPAEGNKKIDISDKFVGTIIADAPQTSQKTYDIQRRSFFNIGRFVIARSIANLEPIGIANAFSRSSEKVYCFLEARDITEDKVINLAWYHNYKRIATVELPIKKGDRWRTYSSKRLMGLRGIWKVELLDVNGTVLENVSFIVE